MKQSGYLVLVISVGTHVNAQSNDFLAHLSIKSEIGIAPYQKYKSTFWKSFGKSFTVYDVALTAEYNIPNSRFATNISLIGSWSRPKDGNMFAIDGHYNYANERYHASFYTMLVGGRYNYFANKTCNIYTGAQIGFTNAHYETIDHLYWFSKNRFAYQLTPFGIEVGSRLRVFFEYGWGVRGIGSLGVKYKFAK